MIPALAVAQTGAEHLWQNVAGWALFMAVVALLILVVFRRQRAIAEGHPPKSLSLRGMRPAKSQRSLWYLAPLVRRVAGTHNRNLERIAWTVAAAGMTTFIVSIIAAIVVHKT